jgi:putative ABC transport system ATP-binding protein
MNHDVIHVKDLSKSYLTSAGLFCALKKVNLSIKSGEFVAIMGQSGSGKSTFMNILGCLDAATEGVYELNGRSVATLNRDELALLRNRMLGFVFQGFNLLQRMTLRDNVALPLIYSGVKYAERSQRAHEMLIKVGLDSKENSLPSQISGGQQQRVAIARALVNNPSLLLADEPTGNLDSHTSEEIMALFEALNKEGITIVLVTHENDIANHAKRQVRFHDGSIVSDSATLQQFDAPAVFTP